MTPIKPSFATLVDMLRQRAAISPERLAYTFLKEGIHVDLQYTFAGLDLEARAIAVALLRAEVELQPGDRVLLIYPPGIEFVAAFFGALYAGLVPIPAPPPDTARFKRTFPRLQGIIRDADARLILSTDSIFQGAVDLGQDSTPWLCSDRVEPGLASDWQPPSLTPDGLAYLQYTSGSTSTPKGVMLTHRNVLTNLVIMQHAWGHDANSVAVTWMPYFHDYGLVDGLLQPLHSGIPCYVISPLTFIKRPQRWLEAISRYRGTHTQGPNFAFEMCVNKVTAAQRDGLDLSCLKVASNGAEPVREATYQRFIETFEPCGFRPEAYYPAFGLAEATLFVTSKAPGKVTHAVHADAATLEHEHRYVPAKADALLRSVMSCGVPQGETRLAIVDADTRSRCADGVVGEIWVSDPSIAVGYLGRTEESESIFRARLADAADSAAYLRTGDLGFIHEGELYVTGRLKDLIIIAGVNHYPQDIEWTVQCAHPDFRPDHCAAFAVEQGGEERLVVVAEVTRDQEDWHSMFDAVRKAVSDSHEIELYAFVALHKGGVYKTSSGKLQRSNCRRAYLEGSLDARALWQKPVTVQHPAPAQTGAMVEAGNGGLVREQQRLADWLSAALAARLELPLVAIDRLAPFASLGLTSRAGVELVGDLETWLGQEALSPTLLWEYPSVAALSQHLAQTLAGLGAIAPETPAKGGTTAGLDGAIAVIGLACRLPGADSPEALWSLLNQRGIAIRSVPDARWQETGLTPVVGVGPGRLATLEAGFLDAVGRFDADLFGIGAREAEIMDPQQRLLLELAWEAFERAGLDADALAGSPTGVFVGISTDDYSLWQLADAERISAYTGTGKAFSIAANRLSYQFDLSGPSLAIDTACSSSLVAIHQACQALRRGECSLALAGGVNLLLAPQMSVALSQAGMLAADGRCKTFDAAADGYVRGEGAGLLVLKPLAAAQRDGDTIAAVILGSAVNQDGRSNGLTAPNGLAQQRVVRAALAAAGVEPVSIGYVETHGTGTALGDPIEVKALQAVLNPGRGADQPLVLGAVKANIGHLEAAAGMAGVVKAILCLQQGAIPPQPALKQLNPLIDLGNSCVVPTERSTWTGPTRRAGISSFGFGGTNAHLVLEVAPEDASVAPDQSLPKQDTLVASERPLHLLNLSARDPQALRELAQRWLDRLDQADAATDLADLCFSASTARVRLPQRLSCLGADPGEMRAALQAWQAGQPGAWQAARAERQTPPRVVFLLTGQGAQSVGMGRALYQSQPVFRRALDTCAELLRPQLGLDLIALLYDTDENDTAAQARLAQTELTQPALFAVEYGLACLWQSWGVQPAAMIGHSVGEYVAAVLAGVFSLADGLRLVATRARLMQTAPGDGAMVSVFAEERTCRSALAGLEDRVVISGFNAPRNHVLSGERTVLEQALARLTAEGIETRPLRVSHAFHSPLMAPVLAAFAEALAGVRFSAPTLPIYTNVTGAVDAEALASPAYWLRHMETPVRFADCVRAAQADGLDVWLEMGPRPALSTLVQQILDGSEPVCLPSLRPNVADTRQMLDSLAALQVRGAPIDWRAFDQAWPRRRRPIPTYPFQGRRYWLPPVPEAGHARPVGVSPFPGRRLHSPLLAHTLFELRYQPSAQPWLGEHRVFGQVVVPGAGHVALMLEAAAEQLGAPPCVLQDVIFPQALVIPDSGARRIQLAVDRSERDGARTCTLISLPAEGDDGWQEHATCRLRRLEPVREAEASGLAEVRAACSEPVQASFYDTLWQTAIGLGARFRWIHELWRGPDTAAPAQVLARLRAPESALGDGFRLHPGLLDSMLQVLAAAVTVAPGEALVPFSIEAFRWWAPVLGSEMWSHVQVRTEADTQGEVVSDVRLYAADGRLLAEALGFRTRRVASSELIREDAAGLREAVYELRWQPIELAPAPLSGTWLVLGASAEAVERLAQAVEHQSAALGKLMGVHCVRALDVSNGQDASPAGYLRLPLAGSAAHELGAALSEQGPLAGVLYLADTHVDEATATLEAAVADTGRVIHLIQALAGLSASGDGAEPGQARALPRLVLLTRSAQSVIEAEAPRSAQAALWGLARVARLEHPDLGCACIDLPAEPVSQALAARVASTLAAALGQADQPELALRQDRVWSPLLERAALAHPSAAAPQFRTDATYLITGGLGALGLALAEWLVHHGARHLLLLGRRAPEAAAQARLQALIEAGAHVATRAVDVTDAVALAACLPANTRSDSADAAAESLPPLAGVFHLAGVLDDAMLMQQDNARLPAVFAPKLGGALYLMRALAGQSLDCFVAFSSVAGLTGSMGQGAYAAANAALDALMQTPDARSLSATSLQWGPWADAGMAAVQSEQDRQRFAGYGIEPIATAAGLAWLGQWLAQARPGAVRCVLPVRWPTYLGQLFAGRPPALYHGVARLEDARSATDQAHGDLAQRVLNAPTGQRRELLETGLRTVVAGVLGLTDAAPIGPRERLFDLGLDSLGAVELRNRLAATLGQSLRATLLFDYPTLSALADHVERDVLGLAPVEAQAETPAQDQGPDLNSLSEDELASLLAAELDD